MQVLVPPGSIDAKPRPDGFVHPSIHIAMLDDVARTDGFCRALRALVRPDDVVVDIGAGTGVLATAAALAGARHVYAIESSGIADVAERVFAANGVSDRVTLIRARSTAVDLPERGNLLVTETIGNEPLDESIVELVADARERLLVPGARVVPSEIELVAFPVDIPDALFARRAFTPERLAAWRSAYGIDFTPLVDEELAPAPFMLHTTRPIPVVGPPTSLVRIALADGHPPTFDAEIELTLDADASRLGIALAFRATLAPDAILSTVPGEVAKTNHWRWQVWPALDCMRRPRGARIHVDYRYQRISDICITDA